MKRFVFLSSLAVVAVAACTKTEFTPVANKEAQIVFNSPVVQLNSKAGHSGEQPGTDGKYSTDETFRVFATWTSGDYAVTDWGKTLYMDGVEVKYNVALGADSKGAWEPETAYYWPKNGKLTFAGYSPADLKNSAATPSSPAVSYGADGLAVTGFEVDPAPAKQFDFMYAERSYNRKSSTNESVAGTGHTAQSYDGVDLMFHHALSSIVFKVKSDATLLGGTKFTLKKIEILNAQYKGDFKEQIADGATYSSTPKWNQDAALTVDYSVWSGSAEVLNAGYVEPSGISDIILLPQSFKRASADKNVKVVITYDVTTNGVTLSSQKAEFDLADEYEDINNNKITAWEIGKRYTYKIYFTLNKIYFSPEVNNWVDVDMKNFDVL